MIQQLFGVATLDLHDFVRFLDLENLTNSGWHCVFFQVKRCAIASNNLNFVLLHDSDFKLINLILTVDVNLDSEGHPAIVVR